LNSLIYNIRKIEASNFKENFAIQPKHARANTYNQFNFQDFNKKSTDIFIQNEKIISENISVIGETQKVTGGQKHSSMFLGILINP
jgi:hypothetical protein